MFAVDLAGVSFLNQTNQTKRGNDCFKNWQLYAVLHFLPTKHKKKLITEDEDP